MEEMLESKAVLSGGFKLKFFGFRFDSCSTADLTLLPQHYSQGVRHYLGLGLSVQVRGPNFLFFPTSAVTVQIFVFLCGAISCRGKMASSTWLLAACALAVRRPAPQTTDSTCFFYPRRWTDGAICARHVAAGLRAGSGFPWRSRRAACDRWCWRYRTAMRVRARRHAGGRRTPAS